MEKYYRKVKTKMFNLTYNEDKTVLKYPFLPVNAHLSRSPADIAQSFLSTENKDSFPHYQFV